MEGTFGGVYVKEQSGSPGHHRCARGAGQAHLCFLLEGSFVERRRGRATSRRAGGLRVSPALDRHDVEFGSRGARCLMIAAPERIAWPSGPRFVRSRALDGLCRSVRAELRRPDAVTPLVVESAAYDCFDLLLGCRAEGGEGPCGWLPRVREYLHDLGGDVPTLDEVAAVAGVHPTHLARTFREAYGCTVGHYARHLRLRRTVELLHDGGESLSRVAHAMGFADQSHMTNAIRAALGVTPGALRRRSAAG